MELETLLTVIVIMRYHELPTKQLKAFTDYQRQELFQGFSQGGVGWSDVRTGHLAILPQIE